MYILVHSKWLWLVIVFVNKHEPPQSFYSLVCKVLNKRYKCIHLFYILQAALGPVAIDEVGKMVGVAESELVVLRGYAEIVSTLCILSIVITAPIGAIVITLTGPRLLSKTTKPPVLEGKSSFGLWHSLRLISI